MTSRTREPAQEMERLGGKGLRVMVAATRDIDPAQFDPEGDLLSLMNRPAR